MPIPEKLKAIVDRMPDPDNQGKLMNVDKDKVEAVITELHEGGHTYILGLIDMLVEPGEGDDVKPHYALHALAVRVCSLPPKLRAAFTRTLSSQIVSNRPVSVRKYLIRQLQVAGGQEVTGELGNTLFEPELRDPSAQALVAIREGAAVQFRAALRKADDALRLTVMMGLTALAEKRDTDLFQKALGDQHREIRTAASRALSRIADARSADVLLKAADTSRGFEKTQHTRACFVLAENLGKAGKKAAAIRILGHILKTRTDSKEKYLRHAAERGLAALK